MSRTIRQRRQRHRRAAHRRTKLLALFVVAFLALCAGGAWAGYDYLKADDEQWPSIGNLRPQRIGQNSVVLAADGTRLGLIRSDQNRRTLPIDRMGKWAPKATVAIEDQRFYEHNGVDPEGVMRALSVNLESGDSREGASTITQQVVRNLYKEITTEKTLPRKAKEATLAMELEQADGWSKEKILETYLNLVFYGRNAYGIEAASLTYFNKSATKLTIAEAAMLAGLPQSPSKYDPYVKAQRPAAKSRRDDVLKAMFEQDMISKAEYDEAVATPITLKETSVFKQRRLPYFFDYVEGELIKQFGAATVRQGGLTIKTTIDPKMQETAEQAIKDKLYDGPSAAIVALDTKTGQIKAMASSSSYAESTFNRAAQAQRQPGSTAKIWVLAAFLQRGVDPDGTTYTSRPIGVRYVGQSEYWEPKTYSGSYSGGMSIRSATVASDNSVYAQMTLDISPEEVAKTAHRMGIKSPLEPFWSIGLGGQEVTPLEQTSFYSTIARGGVRIDPRAVSSATTPGGTKLALKYKRGTRALKDWQADKIVSILRDNVTGGTGTSADIPGAEVSGKTGTTDDAKDAWFCGMTPELTACVWMGYNTPTSMNETGGGTPAAIWRAFMEPALGQVEDRDWFEPKSEPEWRYDFPVNNWMTNPSFETSAGSSSASTETTGPPAAAPVTEQIAEEVAPTEPTPVTPPADGGGVTPAPTPTPPAPAPVVPTPVAPAPTPVAPAPVARPRR